MVELAIHQGFGQAIEAAHGFLNGVQRVVDGLFHLAQVALQIAFNALVQFAIGQMLDDLVDLCNGGLLGLQQSVEGPCRGTHFVILSHLYASAVVKVLRHILGRFLHLAEGLDHRAHNAHGEDDAQQRATAEQDDADQL